MKKIVILILFGIIALIGVVALSDFNKYQSEKDDLQSAADASALSIAIAIKADDVDPLVTFKTSSTDISEYYLAKEMKFAAKLIESNQVVQTRLSRPFRGKIFRKTSLSALAEVQIYSE